ncbi:Chromosome partition protein Smc [bacterium HR10]|nr:Chromosome partition protein Smc [bacterium HR10]
MIRKVAIRNYKSLADVEVELGRFTVLIGPNGSGKSNFVDALRFVRDAVIWGIDAAVVRRGGFSRILHPRAGMLDGEDRRLRIEARIELSTGEPALYDLELDAEETGGYRLLRERLRTSEGEFEVAEGRLVRVPIMLRPLLEQVELPPMSGLVLPTLALGWRAALEVWQILQTMRFFHPTPLVIRTSLAMPVFFAAPPPLWEYGENLSHVLWRLHRDSPEAFAKISEALGAMIPGFVALRPQGETMEIEREGIRLNLWQESDGILRLVAIVTALYEEPLARLLAIEEPELTVHPETLGVLVDLLLERSASGQVIVTTHSPDLLNRLPAEVLRVVEWDRGETKIGPLEREQRSVIEEKYFKMGDLLRLEGLRRELPT